MSSSSSAIRPGPVISSGRSQAGVLVSTYKRLSIRENIHSCDSCIHSFSACNPCATSILTKMHVNV